MVPVRWEGPHTSLRSDTRSDLPSPTHVWFEMVATCSREEPLVKVFGHRKRDNPHLLEISSGPCGRIPSQDSATSSESSLSWLIKLSFEERGHRHKAGTSHHPVSSVQAPALVLLPIRPQHSVETLPVPTSFRVRPRTSASYFLKKFVTVAHWS